MSDNHPARVALVTGAARGLGRAIAEALAADGVTLLLVDILGDRLQQTCADLEASGARCIPHVADISERQQCIAAVEHAVAAFGRLDILCNAAGIVRFNHATAVPEDEWQKIMAINVSGPFWLCQAAIPHLLESHGNIVNVTSQSALIGAAYIVPYSASKGALLQMTRSLAMEYIDAPIRINAVSPGAMATEISLDSPMPEGMDRTKIMRFSGVRPPSDAAEVANLVAFVASEKASAVHGAVLCADGGVTTG